METHPSAGEEINRVSSASSQPEKEAAATAVEGNVSSDSSSNSNSNSNGVVAERSAVISTTTAVTTSSNINSQHNPSQGAAAGGGGAVVPDFDEPKVAPSPAPVPIQGGDDEVIRVSHVRKIIINTNTSKESLASKHKGSTLLPPREEPQQKHTTNNSNQHHQHHHQHHSSHSSHQHHHHDHSSSHNSSSNDNKDKKKKMNRRHIDASDDEESESDSEPMDVIEKSPYEANMDAEKGVELFARMKHVLKERKGGDDYRTVDAEATKIFGPTNAWCLVKANGLIEKSGMVYSQEWCHGNIRGNQIGKIPKDLLLLCLVSNRFAKAQDLLLSGLTRDFEVTGTVQEAIQAWKLTHGYPKILGVSNKNMQFQTRRRDCYKCAIFVGRAYACYKAFGMTEKLESSLMVKVKTCLDLMEAHLPEPNAPSKKKRKSGDLVAAAAVAASVADPIVPNKVVSDTGDAPKRKRGRPRKSPLPEVANAPPGNDEEASLKDSVMHDEDDDLVPYNPSKKRERKSSTASKKKITVDFSDEEEEDDDDMLVPYNPPVRGVSAKSRKSSTTTNGSSKPKSAPVVPTATISLSNLVNKFEAQYEAMGEAYKQMGSTLQELKSKIQENRSATEEEIRNELLLEVQDNLLKSFGKK